MIFWHILLHGRFPPIKMQHINFKRFDNSINTFRFPLWLSLVCVVSGRAGPLPHTAGGLPTRDQTDKRTVHDPEQGPPDWTLDPRGLLAALILYDSPLHACVAVFEAYGINIRLTFRHPSSSNNKLNLKHVPISIHNTIHSVLFSSFVNDKK